MKKAVFKKPFSDYSTNKGFLANLLTKEGYDKEKINRDLNIIKKGLKGESELNYYLSNTFKEIYCLHNIRIKNGKQKSQIDFVAITRDCIWVLESKSLSGNTTVNEDGKFTREEGYCTKYPLIQAEIQANNLKEFLLNKNLIKEDIEVKYKVVFTDTNPKVKINYDTEDIKEGFIDVELISTIFDDVIDEKLSIKDIDMISNCLIRETNSIGEIFINDSDYLLKNNSCTNYNKKFNNNRSYNKSYKQQRISNKQPTKARKKKSSLMPLFIIMIFMGFVWLQFIAPLMDETLSILDMPTEQIANGMTAEERALGEQRFITKVLPKPLGTSQQVEQTSEVILIADDMTKDELISILKTNYSDNYDYAKVTITTSKELFDYYDYISFSKPDNLEELEREHLIGHYFKNTYSKYLDDYGKDRIKFIQKTGNFSDLYNQFVDVK